MRKNKPEELYIRAFYHKNRCLFLAAVLFRLMDVPGMLVVSWLLGAVIDTITEGELTALWRLLVAAIVFVAIFLFVEIGFYRMRAAFLRKAVTQYKEMAFKKLSQKGISAFAQESTGRYLSVLTNDVGIVEENYLNNTFELIAQPLLFLGTLILLCWYSPLLTLAAILLCLLPFAGMMAFSPELARREKAVSDKSEVFVARIKDMLSGFAVIKSFKAEEEAGGIFRLENRSFEETKRRRRWWQGLLTGMSQSLGILVQFGIFFIGAYLALRGDITAGTVLVFVNLANCLIGPIQTVPQCVANRKAAKGLIRKLAEVTEENASRGGEIIAPKLEEAIEFCSVTFGYEPEKPVLKELSLRLEAGKKYALVGASGSGKSTLINLLMGAYDSYEGSLTLDGREMRELDCDSLYDIMSLIGQSVFLFDDTIRRNITMFREFPEEKITSAVFRSGLEKLIAERGEDYRCGENGSGLSGGERQRISIARCLLRETPVLLLDEATAALDNQTAFAVTDAILQLDGLTRLVVTHRLEAQLLEQYDSIFVLREGHLQESGTFAELMERRGYFYSLYTVSNTETA